MRKISETQSSINRKLTQVYREIDEKRGLECEGCGSNKYLTHSHRVPRGRVKRLELKKNNIDIYCMTCHREVEDNRFWKLENGESVIRYIVNHDPHGINRLMKMGDRMIEDKLPISEQKYWTELIIKIIDECKSLLNY